MKNKIPSQKFLHRILTLDKLLKQVDKCDRRSYRGFRLIYLYKHFFLT